MKSQYLGDINDYVKYGFLRRLTTADTPLVMCWMLTADDGGRDGNRRAYLSDATGYRHYDPQLFDALARELRHVRDVAVLQGSGVLASTTFFDAYVVDDLADRSDYFRALLKTLRHQSLVFFDPDNGLDVPSVPIGRRNSSKYLYRAELREIISAGHSAIVYQHFPRVERRSFLDSVLSSTIGRAHDLRTSAVFTSNVAYLLFLQPPHDRLVGSARAFARDWQPITQYFDLK